jgi:hypothetical protein
MKNAEIPPTGTVSGRQLRPRKRDDYDNRVHGYDDMDEANISSPSQPRLPLESDSRDLIRKYDGELLDFGISPSFPEFKDAWHESEAFDSLTASENCTGIWIPRWIAKECRNARQARLESWLLWWFDDETTRSRKRSSECQSGSPPHGTCRARLRDASGERVLITSCSRLAREVNFDRWSVKRHLGISAPRFNVETPTSGVHKGSVLISPKHRGLIEAWAKHGNCDSCRTEIHDLDAKREYWDPSSSQFRPGWYESNARRLALNRNRSFGPVAVGTYVFDVLLVACDMRIGEAELLSDILWWFGYTTGPKVKRTLRARIRREGYLWIARSSRHLERDWGISRSNAKRWLEYLVEEKRYLVAAKWLFNAKMCRSQDTLHLRPNTPVLELAVKDALFNVDDIAEAKGGRW